MSVPSAAKSLSRTLIRSARTCKANAANPINAEDKRRNEEERRNLVKSALFWRRWARMWPTAEEPIEYLEAAE